MSPSNRFDISFYVYVIFYIKQFCYSRARRSFSTSSLSLLQLFWLSFKYLFTCLYSYIIYWWVSMYYFICLLSTIRNISLNYCLKSFMHLTNFCYPLIFSIALFNLLTSRYVYFKFSTILTLFKLFWKFFIFNRIPS